MQLVDSQNHPYPTSISVPADSDGFTVYSLDDNGDPVQAYWLLVPAGQQNNNGKGTTFYGSKSVSFWIGTLSGFIPPAIPTATIQVGPSFSVGYVPPPPSLIDQTNYATITATPADGSPSRQIQITITFNGQIF